jgi:RNA polymerase sigma-70 factor (sigma-E family)
MRRERDGDFDEYYTARAPQLRRVAFLVVHDWQAAEDIVQSTFVKVYLKWPKISQSTVDAYVRRAVVNASVSYLRGRRRRRETLTPTPPETAPMQTARVGPSDPIPAVLAHLPPAQRAVLALRFVDDLSVADVSEALGISEGAVKSQTSRGLSRLRQLRPEYLR